MEDVETFVKFLIEAKRSTYAAGAAKVESSRPASHDLRFERGEYLYLDTYLGGIDFGGEEAVWRAGQPVWCMNYYGRMLVEAVPAGFSETLLGALTAVPPEGPFRGPAEFWHGAFTYRCQWQGDLEFFSGRETIEQAGQPIYELLFHGGRIR